MTKAIQQARDYWPTAPKDEVDELRTEVVATEIRQLELYQRILDKEKEIRNSEIVFLTKNR